MFFRVFLVLILSLSVTSCVTPIVIAPNTLPDAQISESYEQTLEVTGGAGISIGRIYVSSGNLPPGLKVKHKEHSSTAVLSGKPIQDGVFRFKIEAWSYGANFPGQRGEQEYTLVVKETK